MTTRLRPRFREKLTPIAVMLIHPGSMPADIFTCRGTHAERSHGAGAAGNGWHNRSK